MPSFKGAFCRQESARCRSPTVQKNHNRKNYYYYWSLLYSAILLLRSFACDWEWVTVSFQLGALYNTHRNGVLTDSAGSLLHGWCHVKTAAVWAVHVLSTPCTSLQYHFIRSHVYTVHVCLTVTCHLHLLAEWPGSFAWWNGQQNESARSPAL